MLNVTARLAVSIKNVPNWDVDWNDSTPQRPRSSLNCSHFLPTAQDAEALNNTATQYVMEFLVEHFDSLSDLKPILPQRKSPHPAEKPTVVPMKILFRDEKYKTETIEIIRQLMEDAKLSGNSQVHITLQCSCMSNQYTHTGVYIVLMTISTHTLHVNTLSCRLLLEIN